VPTTQPRISTVVEEPVYAAIKRLADRENLSISQQARALIVEALELVEDTALEAIVLSRKRKSKKSHSLAEVRKKLKAR